MIMIFKFLIFILISVRVLILDVNSQIPTNTLPSLKTIDAGSVNVSTSNNSLNINQSSQQAIISWNSFNVGSSAKVNFNQPSASATTLNKIFDARPSQIFGQINANGKIILQNSAGIYFGPSSTLNVGSIVATTGTISNQDFLNNKFNFSRNNSKGNIVNEGSLKAIDNFVALLAPNIRNEGLIFAEKGSIVLSTGDEVTLNFQNNGHISSIVSTPSSIDSLIQNNKAIEAPGGKIILSARAISDLVSGVINQNGTINSGSKANVVVNQGGKIFLEASSIKMSSNSSTTSKAKDIGGDISIIGKEISIDNNSVIDASGNSAGNIKILSNQENLEIKNSIIRSNSQLGDAGAIALSAVKNFLISGSTIEATGTNKGGKILLGYDFAGQTLPFAQNASFDENTYINASSTNGAGGFIETSGQTLYIRSRINAGRGGQWLVDPFDLTIDATVAGQIVSAINSGSNVSLTTSTQNYSSYSLTGVSGLGNINLNSPIVATGEGTLSLTAANNIYLNKIIDLSGTASSLTLNAGNTIYYASNVTTKNNQTYTAVSHQISSQSTLQSKTGNIEIIGDIYSGYNILALLGNGNYLLNNSLLTANSNDQVVYNPQTKTYQLIDNISSAEALIVAGGGGGGMDMGGGGGGGGVIAGTYSFGGTTINVTVGAGGSGAPAGGTNGQNGGHNFNINASSGANSTLQYEGGTLEAVGGGYGGTSYWTSPLGGQGGSGGSGGGAAGYNAGTSGKNGSGTAGQGHAGASGFDHHVSGGGGGAGAPGNTARSNGGSSGGAGVENCILGSCYYWGGGGGGAGFTYTGGNGGIGGGGGGAVGTTTGGAGYNNGSAGGGGGTGGWAQTPGGNGGTNTGGGGGGGSHYNTNNKGGDGGSGIVVLKYQKTLSLITNLGSVNIRGNVSGASLSIQNNAASQIDGIISGSSSLTKSGNGSLALLKANTYSGSTKVSSGSLIIEAINSFSSNSKLNLTGILDLKGRSVQAAGLEGNGTITSSSLGTYNFNVVNNIANTFTGIIENGTGTLSLTKSGAGELILSGNNTYTGGTNLNGGTITLNSAGAIGSSGTISFGGGELKYSANNATDYSSRLSGASGQAFKVNTNGRTVTWASDLTNASSSITKSGSGTWTIGVLNLANAIINEGTFNATSITISGTNSIGGTISTTGAVSFSGATTLVRDTTITSSNNTISFGSTINGEYELIINAGSSTASFAGAIGGATPVVRLQVSATSGISFGGNITTVMGLSDGLYFEKFRGTFGSNMQWFNTATRVDVDSGNAMSASIINPITTIHAATDAVPVKTATSTQIYYCPSQGCDDNYAVRTTGYFIPTATGTHTFATYADDDHYLFIGNANENISNFITRVQATTAQPSFGDRGLVVRAPGCCTTVTGTVNLEAGSRYPIYSVFNEGGGADYMWTKFMLPGASSYVSGVRGEVSNGTSYYYSNPTGASGGSGSRAGIYLTGNTKLTGNSVMTSSNATVSITGSLTSDATPRDLSVNTSTFAVGNVSSMANVTISVSSLTAGNFTSINNLNLSATSFSTGTYNVNQSITFNNASALTVSNTISGDGKIIKTGVGTLTLSGSNTFTGGANINAGVLSLGSVNAIGSSGTISFGGGTLQYTSSNTTDYSSRFSTASSQAYKLDTNGQNITWATGLTSSGGSLVKSGSGTLTLSGDNTYSGSTTLSVGNLTLTGNNSTSGAININAGVLSLGSANAIGSSGTISFGGGTLQYTSSNTTDYSSRFSTASSQAYNIDTNGQNITWATGLTSSGGSLVKSGSGTLTLSGANTYAGSTSISAGTIKLGRANALSSLSAITLPSGTSLDITGYSQSFKSITGAGTITSSATGTPTLTMGADNTSFTFAGVIENGSATVTLTKSGSGTLTLSGSNTFTGGANINAGVLSLGSANAIGSSGTISFGGGTLQYTSSNITDYSSRLSGSSGQAFKVDTNGRTVTWASNLTNASSSITKSGTGTLTISNAIGVSSVNIVVTGGTLNLPGTETQLAGLGTISLQGGTLICPNCPTLGDVVATANSSLTFSGLNAVFRTLTLASGVTMEAGSITVTGVSSLGGTITATTGDINFGSAVTLVAGTTITNTDRNVVFGSTIDGFNRLEVQAGSGRVTFNGAIGGTNAIGELTVVASGGIYLNNITIQGLSNGLYFEKFRGNFNSSNMQWFTTATRADVDGGNAMSASIINPITTIHAATDSVPVKTATSTQIYYCPSTNCDEQYSVRVTGYFISTATGTHTFATYADDGHFLFMGNANENISDFITRVQATTAQPSLGDRGLVVNAPGCCATVTGTVNLEAGNRYPIYSVFNEFGGGDYMWTKFMLPGASSYVSGVRGEVSNGLGYYYSNPNGASGGGGVTGVSLTGPVTLNGNSTISSTNASVTIAGTLSSDATPRNFVVNAQSFNAQALSSLSNLSVTVKDSSAITGIISSASSVTDMQFTKAGDGILTLSGANTYAGSTLISAGTLKISGANASLGASTNSLTIAGGTLDLINKALTLNALTMNNANSFITNTSGTSSMTVTNPSSLRGSITTQGTQTYSDVITLTGNMSFATTNNDITFSSTVSGPYDLTVNSGSGITRFNGALSNIVNFSSLGKTILDRSIATTGTQTYGATTLSAGVLLSTTNDDITFNSTLAGSYGLSANVGTAQVVFSGRVGGDGNLADALEAISITGKAYILENIYTKNDQTYSTDITISGARELKSINGSITLGGNITAAGSATIVLLGGGSYKYNADSYTATSALNTITGISYSSSTGLYSWSAPVSSSEILLVAGGGGGGMDMGGGGGGGGVIAGTYSFAAGTTYNIKVGTGGSGGPAGGTSGQPGGHQFTIRATSGGNSTLQYSGGTLTAIGGGYGGSSYWAYLPDNGYGSAGGSGGGASAYSDGNTGRGGAGTTGQGYAGGGGQGQFYGGGGGGAAGAGGSGRSNGNAYGGPGVENCILGSCYYWGGGGGGSGYSVTGGNGGIGGGGGGAVGTTTGGAGYNNGSAGGGGCTNCWAQTPGGNAGANTGGGGGGGSHYNTNNKGGDGGSGIAALKYRTQSSLILNAENGNINLPSDLRITNLSSFKITQKTNTPNITFTNLNLINSSFELKNQNLKVSTLSVDSTSSITTPTNQTSSLEVTGTSSIGGSISTALTFFEKNDSATGKKEKWGQYYGDLITLTGNASFNSEGKDIHFNGIRGDHNLTVSATTTCGQGKTICGGWVVFNGKVGDAPFVETNATVVALNGTETAYHSNYDYLNFRSKSTLNVKSISVNADEIYIRADIITSLTQTYNGHVNIGDNGTNGTTRSLISIDPEIRFIGKSLAERDGNKYKESDFKYSFDDESITPTHSLILIAKGYCYVSSLVCGEVGNIRLAYNANGEKVYYNAIRPLKSLSTNNITMLFPDRNYFIGVNINFNNIPKGTIDGETAVNPEGISGLPVSFEQFLNPTFFEGVNNKAELRKITGEKVSSYLQSNNFSKSPREVSFKAYSGEVIIGGVRADFNDNATFGFSINTDKSAGSKNSKNENKNSKIEDKNTKIDNKKTQTEECKDIQADNCI